MEAAALSRAAGDAAGVARALTMAGLAAIYSGDYDQATSALEEARATAAVVAEAFTSED